MLCRLGWCQHQVRDHRRQQQGDLEQDQAQNTAKISTAMRNVREQARELTIAASAVAAPARALAKVAAITVYDCKHHQTLPGALVAKPGIV